MPKAKSIPKVSEKSHTKIQHNVDVGRSVAENLSDKTLLWEKVQKKIEQKNELIRELQLQYNLLEDTPKNRSQRAELRIKIEDENRKLRSLKSEIDEVNFLSCIAKLIQEDGIFKDEIPKEINNKSEMLVSVTGPLRQRERRKKINKNVLCGKSTMVTSKSIESFIAVQSMEENQIDNSKRLAQIMGEIPVEFSEFEYCPVCPDKIVMEFIEKPPQLCCPKCGICRDTLDVNSAVVHDKETPVHIPFTYRPKQHFISWIRRVTGELNYHIEQEIIDRVHLELYHRRIFDVNDVTWDVVDKILRKLAKRVNKDYNRYYQHVYQITNIIRRAPILTLSDTRKQKLYEMFDIIYAGWERFKTDERSNFMSNAFVLQMCFRILGYPEKIVNMFNMLKGSDNLKEYDRICEIICKENDWPFVRSSAISDAKYSGGKTLLDYWKKSKDSKDDSNNTTDSPNKLSAFSHNQSPKNNNVGPTQYISVSSNANKRKAENNELEEPSSKKLHQESLEQKNNIIMKNENIIKNDINIKNDTNIKSENVQKDGKRKFEDIEKDAESPEKKKQKSSPMKQNLSPMSLGQKMSMFIPRRN